MAKLNVGNGGGVSSDEMRFEVEIWGMKARVRDEDRSSPKPQGQNQDQSSPQTTWDAPCGPALISLSLQTQKKIIHLSLQRAERTRSVCLDSSNVLEAPKLPAR